MIQLQLHKYLLFSNIIKRLFNSLRQLIDDARMIDTFGGRNHAQPIWK